MGSIQLTKEDEEIVYLSLSMRKCFIETGDPHISASEAKSFNKTVKPLSIDQMKLVIRINELMNMVLKD